MTEEMDPSLLGEARFHQACLPPLSAGDYRLTATQSLRGDAKTIAPDFESTAHFTVSGPRFFLKPSDVYAVYPPAGQFGAFDNTLPHIVFTRRTLPWERSLDGKPQDVAAPVPWLALLLLGKDDFDDKQLPKVTARNLTALLDPGGEIQGPQDLKLEGGQEKEDLCNTLDLPASVFAKIAPTLQDLPLLAHVREVKTSGKETLSLKQDGWFSMVVCNRLPATSTGPKGDPNLVCLVSVEGFAGLLKTEVDGKATVVLPAGKSKVRLAVLASWSFTCHGKNNFKAAMSALDCAWPLRLPSDKLAEDDAGTKTVRRAFELGYTGLNHTTRLGEKTVSWYRGPLVPVSYPPPISQPASSYPFIPCADRALRYDPENGLLAAEYAAAYELGRMMALQNRSFAAAMFRLRQRNQEDLHNDRCLGQLKRELGVVNAFDDGIIELLGRLSDESATTHPRDQGTPPEAPEPESPLPKEVTQFLARAFLLYGVPFQYLVPDERMLPQGSIRFFYLDPGWIATLLQGATSIGRLGERDTPLDERLRRHVLTQALDDCARVRDSLPHEREVKAATWPLTGFLLRSEVVEGWQGLEMHAHDAEGASLAPLRIDRLSPEVLLCIFNGEVRRLIVKQPPEGLHFGLSCMSNGGYERLSLRKVTLPCAGVQPGDLIASPGVGPFEAPMRQPLDERHARTRCVRMAAFADAIKSGLAQLKHPSDQVGSAELAVQLIESPGVAEFVVKP